MPSNLKRFWGFLAVLGVGFAVPLYELVRFAAGSQLYSHILLVPFVAVYLGWDRRGLLFRGEADSGSQSHRGWGVLAAVVGAVLFLSSQIAHGLVTQDRLALGIGAFVCFLYAGCFWFLGRETVRSLAFSLGFLVFLLPFPTIVEHGIVAFLQHGSALVAFLFFKISGTPVMYDDTSFQLPGFNLQVAPECSGIHSTLVLFITSVVASWMFLRTPWKRATLGLAIIPLALLRNGFRVFVIGMLCVHVNPEMIDSPIHHRGGPVFFALSLIPFFILLLYLYKSDRRLHAGVSAHTKKSQESKIAVC